MDDLITQNMKKQPSHVQQKNKCKRFALQVFDFQRLALQVKRFSQR